MAERRRIDGKPVIEWDAFLNFLEHQAITIGFDSEHVSQTVRRNGLTLPLSLVTPLYLKTGSEYEMWATEANVVMSFDWTLISDVQYALTTNVSVHWSSTSRDVAHATSALYYANQAVTLAALVETYTSGKYFVLEREK